jgi:hypothetical protein
MTKVHECIGRSMLNFRQLPQTNTGCLKSFATFFFLKFSTADNNIWLELSYQKMHNLILYKLVYVSI